MTTYSDDLSILVTNAQTGNYDAFNGLVRRFQDMAVGYAYAIIGDFQLAEDAAQEAFVGAWLELPRLREPAAFAGWFRKLVFMRCSRQTRALRRGVVSTEALELIDPAPSAATVLDDVDRRRQVYRALAGMSDEERLVTVLFYIGRHTHAEISSFLDLPRETINNRLRAARKHLETGLIDMAQDEFHQHAPSRNDGFATRVATLSQPEAMNTERYVYGVVPMNGRDAWALFCASAAGDLARVRDLLDRDANLVNAQYWYQFPIHMAAREGHADVVQVLLEEGADPGQSRYTYNSWDKLLEVANDRDHRAVSKLLQTVMAERFGYDERFTELAAAIRDRDRARIDALLGATPDLINHADALGNGPLHWAALTRQLDLIDRFHELGADIDVRRADGRSPVRVAIDGDYWYRPRDLPDDAISDPWIVARRLLDRGARLDLDMACSMGDVERVEEILAQDPSAARRLDPSRCSPLFRAASSGHAQAVRLLLDRGADPSIPEDLAPRGRALHAAASRNDLNMAELLLEHGADPNAEVDSSGDCQFVVEYDHPRECGPMQELLRQHGATPTPPSTDDDLKKALRSGYAANQDWAFMVKLFRSTDPELHDLFLQRFADVVPGLVAGDVWGGELPTLELLAKLLDHGLDPNRPNWIGRTFLHVAAEKGSIEVAEALLEAGADFEVLELEHGGTPLAAAAREGQVEMVGFLLKKGADPATPPESPWATANAWAKRKQDENILSLLNDA
jgi:RNA polymerase sigma factor (sigma-70 family)